MQQLRLPGCGHRHGDRPCLLLVLSLCSHGLLPSVDLSPLPPHLQPLGKQMITSYLWLSRILTNPGWHHLVFKWKLQPKGWEAK